MASATDNWLTIIGFGAVAVFAYYLHTRGTFNEIFDAINKGLDEIKNTKAVAPEKIETETETKLAYAYVGDAGPHRAFVSY